MKAYAFKAQRLDAIKNCLAKIEENQAALQCIRIMKKLIKVFPLYPNNMDYNSQGNVIENLVKNNKLFEIFFSNFTEFRSESRKLAEGHGDERGNFHKTLLSDNIPYKDHIEERLQLLTIIITTSYRVTL